MKKSAKTKRTKGSTKSNHTGVALLLCFLVASVAVAIALRQLALERRLNQQNTETNSTTSVVGVYKVNIIAGKFANKTITLSLSKDRSAELSYELENPQKKVTLVGNWSGDSNGTVITNFEDAVYAFSYNPSGTGALKLLNPDVEFWGAATLTLTRN